MSQTYINQKLDSYEQKIDYLNMNPYENNQKTLNQLNNELKMLISVQSSMSQRELQRFKNITKQLNEDINVLSTNYNVDVDLLKEYLKKKSQKSIDKKVSFLDYKYKKERSKHYFNYEKRKKQVQKQKGGILGFGFLNRDGTRKIKEPRQTFQYPTMKGPKKTFTGTKSQFDQFMNKLRAQERLYSMQINQRKNNQYIKKEFFEQKDKIQSQRKDKIVNEYIGINKLPNFIDYPSLLSYSYYENYTGQNQKSLPKNILNIGEQHFYVKKGFDEFISFLEVLIIKNSHLNLCLDFIIEQSIEDIFNYKSNLQNVNNPQIKNDSLQYMQIKPTLLYLRNFMRKNNFKGFRSHFTDTRLGYNGFNASLISILGVVRDYLYEDFAYGTKPLQNLEFKDIYKGIILHIYKGESIYNYTENEVLKSIWYFLLSLHKKKEVMIQNSIKQSAEEMSLAKLSEDQEIIKYYKNHNLGVVSELDKATMFIDSINSFLLEFCKETDVNILKQKIKEEEYVIPSVKDYYDYILQKSIFKRNTIEQGLIDYKKLDSKFAKQLDNIDTSYFLYDPKKIILGYFIEMQEVELATFYDIQSIARLFRKFDEGKNRFKSCDSENSMKNVIIYSGNHHTKNINRFLQYLPLLYIDSDIVKIPPYNYMYDKELNFDPKIVKMKHRWSSNGLDKLSGPILTDTKKKWGWMKYDEGIPTSFDWFGYNNKIITQLKTQNSVQNYRQLLPIVNQIKSKRDEETERKQKEKEKQQLKKKKQEQERKRVQEQERKKIQEERKKIQEERKKIQEETFLSSFGYGKGVVTPDSSDLYQAPFGRYRTSSGKLNIKFENGYTFKGVVRYKDFENKRRLDGTLKLGNENFFFKGQIFTDGFTKYIPESGEKNIKYYGEINYTNGGDYIYGHFDREFNLIKSSTFAIKFDNQEYSTRTHYDYKSKRNYVLDLPKEVEENLYPNMTKSEITSNQMKLGNQLFEKEILNFDVVKNFIEQKVKKEALLKKQEQQRKRIQDQLKRKKQQQQQEQMMKRKKQQQEQMMKRKKQEQQKQQNGLRDAIDDSQIQTNQY
jgi:hypothetical protein